MAPENIGYDKVAAADRNRHDCSFAAHFRADDRKFTYNLGEVHSEPGSICNPVVLSHCGNVSAINDVFASCD